MIYVDTSVMVAMYTHETSSKSVDRWYSACMDELVSSVWCVTEFASALGIKQRTSQIDKSEALIAWQQFERFCANDLQLLPAEPLTFHSAAVLTFDASSSLRAGDALHLAAAHDAKANSIATLDKVLAKNAKRHGLEIIKF
jgi:predicted nucleic acid-binding protein